MFKDQNWWVSTYTFGKGRKISKTIFLGFNSSKKLKFIYSEKATKFCEISTVDLSNVVPVKSTVEISQNVVAFSEYMNFNNMSTICLFLLFSTKKHKEAGKCFLQNVTIPAIFCVFTQCILFFLNGFLQILTLWMYSFNLLFSTFSRLNIDGTGLLVGFPGHHQWNLISSWV